MFCSVLPCSLLVFRWRKLAEVCPFQKEGTLLYSKEGKIHPFWNKSDLKIVTSDGAEGGQSFWGPSGRHAPGVLSSSETRGIHGPEELRL